MRITTLKMTISGIVILKNCIEGIMTYDLPGHIKSGSPGYLQGDRNFLIASISMPGSERPKLLIYSFPHLFKWALYVCITNRVFMQNEGERGEAVPS